MASKKKVGSQNPPDDVMAPISTGKSELRLPFARKMSNRKDGFAQIPKKYREDGSGYMNDGTGPFK